MKLFYGKICVECCWVFTALRCLSGSIQTSTLNRLNTANMVIVWKQSSPADNGIVVAQSVVCNLHRICLVLQRGINCKLAACYLVLFSFSAYKAAYTTSLLLKLNLWLTALKGATPVNQTSEKGWQMAVRLDNVISISLRQVYQCRLS